MYGAEWAQAGAGGRRVFKQAVDPSASARSELPDILASASLPRTLHTTVWTLISLFMHLHLNARCKQGSGHCSRRKDSDEPCRLQAQQFVGSAIHIRLCLATRIKIRRQLNAIRQTPMPLREQNSEASAAARVWGCLPTVITYCTALAKGGRVGNDGAITACENLVSPRRLDGCTLWMGVRSFIIDLPCPCSLATGLPPHVLPSLCAAGRCAWHRGLLKTRLRPHVDSPTLGH
ncbi:hypothetical protein CC78DRAFT_578595 [Lojkania enalia]|uniref:Uncharacterized protein n=1 Tax=Lojkania enalia TaxID=147567 RepID=A0A9P4N5E6_9PLEO|nr:hypothetical protein CC78DRAFT_578595 [Didymosphaeria enalia]